MHVKDYFKSIKHVPSKWEDLEYDHMSHKFCFFATYMVNYVDKKTRVTIILYNKTAPKNYVMGMKAARTAT